MTLPPRASLNWTPREDRRIFADNACAPQWFLAKFTVKLHRKLDIDAPSIAGWKYHVCRNHAISRGDARARREPRSAPMIDWLRSLSVRTRCIAWRFDRRLKEDSSAPTAIASPANSVPPALRGTFALDFALSNIDAHREISHGYDHPSHHYPRADPTFRRRLVRSRQVVLARRLRFPARND